MDATKMTLARAFTTRRSRTEKPSSVPYIGRAASQRSPNSKPIMRAQISAPVQLLSTTNMLSYEAPDIVGTPRVATRNVFGSASSVTSGSSSDTESDGNRSSIRSRGTITDASSVEDWTPSSPEPNHLSCYFKTSQTTESLPSRSSTVSSRQSVNSDSPSIPQRAASHSIKAHVQLSRQRSVQRILAKPEDKSVRDSIDMFTMIKASEAPVTHPFGRELEQLSEVQEEFGSVVRDVEAEADRAVMLARGLLQFCASDYMQAIADPYTNVFAEDAAMYQPVAWI